MDGLHSQYRPMAEEFQLALRRGNRPRIEDFLSQEGSRPEQVFAQLLAIEATERRERGELPAADDYYSRFPQFHKQIASFFANTESNSMMSASTVVRYDSQGEDLTHEHSSQADLIVNFQLDQNSGPDIQIRDLLGLSGGLLKVPADDGGSAYRVDQLCDKFEQEWRQGRRPEIEVHLQKASFDDQPSLFRELVALDWEFRQNLQERPTLQDYAQRFPAFAHLLKFPNSQGVNTAAVDAEGKEVSPRQTPSNRGADSTLDPPATTISGRYRLEKLVGRGGFAEVWLATDNVLRRRVAVKRPRTDRPERHAMFTSFLKEAQRVAGMDCLGIVPVYDVCADDGRHCIVSQFIDGETLDARMKSGPVAIEDAVEIVAQVAETLHRAHLLNVVHRDIKPGNILLNRAGKPFVTDFGLAVSEQEQLLEQKTLLGTCLYMSPEQARGDCHLLDARSDTYSLGVVLYQLLTGRLPFLAKGQREYIDQILHRDIRPLRTIDDKIPRELERICLKCVEKQAANRYTTALDFATDLRAWQAELQLAKSSSANSLHTTLPQVSHEYVPPLFGKRLKIGLLLVVPCLLILAIGFGVFRDRGTTPHPPPPGEVESNLKNAWKKRLGQLPIEIVLPGPPGDGFGEFREGLGAFEISSGISRMFSLGSATANINTIDITLSQTPWENHAGIFLGYHEVPVKNSTEPRFEAIWMEAHHPENKPPEIRICRASGAVASEGNRWRSLTKRGFETVPWPKPGDKCHLRVQYTGHKVVAVSWNGRRLDELTTDFCNRDLRQGDLVGEWGIWQRGGTTRFFNPSFTSVIQNPDPR